MKQTILNWYQENYNDIDAVCGGRGDCGNCKVRFLKNAPAASKKEETLLTAEEINAGIRLACLQEMQEGMEFETVGAFFNTRSEGGKSSTVVEKSDEIKKESCYGIALDIGTTNIAMRLVGLDSGNEIKTITVRNPERSFGADVMSRVQAANEGQLFLMQVSLKKVLTSLLLRLLTETQVELIRVKRIVIAANVVMCHILRGYSCEGLGSAPFAPVSLALERFDARELLFFADMAAEPEKELNELQAEVILLPGITSFVGGDITAGIYACDMDKQDKIQMLVDVGTNGEMVLFSKGKLWVTSTAAGSAFENGRILQGSQWIEWLAKLKRADIIDENGTLVDEYFDEGYPLYGKFRLKQSDIREVQMSKAAIRAGMEILTKEMTPEVIYLAGAFGRAINVRDATQIGLFPKEIAGKVMAVGNTALQGAHKFLVEQSGEKRLEGFINGAREILLSEDVDFEEKYIKYMQVQY